MPFRRYGPEATAVKNARSTDQTAPRSLAWGRRSLTILAVSAFAVLALLVLPHNGPVWIAVALGTRIGLLVVMALACWAMPSGVRLVWWSLWWSQVIFVTAQELYAGGLTDRGPHQLAPLTLALFLGAYLPAFLALGLILRANNPGHDQGTWTDVGIVTASAAAMVGSLALGPVETAVRASDPSYMDSAFPLISLPGHPALDLALVALLATALLGGQWRRLAILLVAGSFGVLLAADLLLDYQFAQPTNSDGSTFIPALLVVAMALMAAASTTPDAARIAEPREADPVEFDRARVAFVAVAAILVPLLLLWAVWTNNDDHARFLAVLTLVIAALGVWRARTLLVALRADKQFVGAIVESAGEGIVRLDSAGRTIFANPEARRILGCREEDLLGLVLHDVTHYRKADGTPCLWSECPTRLVVKGLTREELGRTDFLRRDGSMFPVEYVTTAVTHEGATVGAVLMFRDVSDRVALDQAKGQFVALVSHELRTPLTSIKGNLKLLEAGVVGPLTEKQRSLLSAAVANSARLESLVNDLLDMERLDDGKLPIHPETVSARDLASQSVAAIKGAADAVSIPVGLDVADCPDDTWVVVDPNRMLQVLTNLLGNALKFSERGQHVNVVVNRCGDAVTIAVVDAGRGIPESEVGHIFDRFSQVDSRDTRQVGGVGLGLAIARELVTRSGGTLDVVSQVGSGSTFTVHLPAA